MHTRSVVTSIAALLIAAAPALAQVAAAPTAVADDGSPRLACTEQRAGQKAKGTDGRMWICREVKTTNGALTYWLWRPTDDAPPPGYAPPPEA
ncbi:hypothetical protein [Nocardia thraciensis]